MAGSYRVPATWLARHLPRGLWSAVWVVEGPGQLAVCGPSRVELGLSIFELACELHVRLFQVDDSAWEVLDIAVPSDRP